MNFIVDTIGDETLTVKTELIDEEESNVTRGNSNILTLFATKCKELDDIEKNMELIEKKLSTTKFDNLVDDFFEDMGWGKEVGMKKKMKHKRSKKFHFQHLDKETGKLDTDLGKVDVEKEMEKSVLQPGFEQLHSIPAYSVSQRKLKAERKKERDKSKGPNWFNMAAPEITEELKNDLQVLKMRSVMDPKRFYKKNDMEVLPKYFQVGRVVDSPLDHQSHRISNKDRKRTMVEELLNDAEFNRYNKKKYKEIIEEKKKTNYRSHMRSKREKQKKFAKDKNKNK